MITNFLNANFAVFLLGLFFLLVLFLSLASVFLAINTIYSTFSLMLVFLIVSLFLFINDLEFMAIVYTAVYVGAVSIFFMFTLMTINIRFEDTLEYYDEVYSDKNFSFVILALFSFLIQTVFYIEFKNQYYLKEFIQFYTSIISYSKNSKSDLFSNLFFDMSSNSNVLENYSNLFSENHLKFYFSNNPGPDLLIKSGFYTPLVKKFDIYYDVHFVSYDLYNNRHGLFFVLTYLLLFSMLSSIGFAIRSK